METCSIGEYSLIHGCHVTIRKLSARAYYAFIVSLTVRLWEVIQQNAHASNELLKNKVAAGLSADKPERTAQVLDQWAQPQAEMLVELLQTLQ